MWQFEQATHGLKDACEELGIPVTGGNVSFYNQTGETPILPTPVVGILGVIDDVRARITQGSSATASTCSCSARPARSSAARPGPTSSTATSAAGRRSSTSTPSAPWPR